MSRGPLVGFCSLQYPDMLIPGFLKSRLRQFSTVCPWIPHAWQNLLVQGMHLHCSTGP